MRFFPSKQEKGVHYFFIPKTYPSQLFKFQLLSKPELPLVLQFSKCSFSLSASDQTNQSLPIADLYILFLYLLIFQC